MDKSTGKQPAPKRRRTKRQEQFLKYIKQNTWLVLLAVLILIALILFICVITGAEEPEQEQPTVVKKTGKYQTAYISAKTSEVPYYDDSLMTLGTVVRGSQVTYSTDKPLKTDDKVYYMTYLDDLQHGYIDAENLDKTDDNIVQETEIYVRTPQNLHLSADGIELGELVVQGTELKVRSFDYITDGVVHQYEVEYGGQIGYIGGEYTAGTLEAATEIYDRFGVTMIHGGRLDYLGGGDGGSLDYNPRKKASFEDNVMPENVYALYMTADPEVIGNVDKYIEYAKSTKINAFVVNIMDGTSIGYPSEVYLKYSPTAYKYANNSLEEFQDCIRKIKEAGFYAIGRLTTFNDSFFCTDHPEYAICDNSGDPLYIASSYWPSAFCRYVWEYKVALGQEAVDIMGFDEIQFDYVRFPDGTYFYERDGIIDYHNQYNETKAQAIQRFLMYATDELHDCGVYVGADVFGETCRDYVTAYGQYWPAISNVVDVISGMPYPDHFAQDHSYRPWEHPYDTLLDWAENAAKRQSETPTPAIARTWVQAYNAIREPYNTYGPQEVGGEIQALLDGNLPGGFMAWNAACSLEKLAELKPLYDTLGDTTMYRPVEETEETAEDTPAG